MASEQSGILDEISSSCNIHIRNQEQNEENNIQNQRCERNSESNQSVQDSPIEANEDVVDDIHFSPDSVCEINPTSMASPRFAELLAFNDNNQPSTSSNTIGINNQSNRGVYNWQGTKATLQDRIVFLFDNEILSDVVFIVGKHTEKRRVPAHKLVLSCGSAVFDAMFNGTLATAAPEIEITDVEPLAFLAVLRFLYTDEIKIDPENVMGMLYTAKKYAVSAMEKYCVDYLKNNLTADNAFVILSQAQLFDEAQLANSCLNIIDRFTPEAFNADGFTDIDEQTLSMVLKRNTLRASESTIFQAVIKWAEAECSRQQLQLTPINQRKVLEKVFPLIRFPIMSTEEFTAGPAKSGLLNYQELVTLFSYFTLNPKPLIDYPIKPRWCISGKEQTVCRFPLVENRWGYNGTCDRIRFAVNKTIYLLGYGIYGSMNEPATYNASIELLHCASQKVLATGKKIFSTDGSKYTYSVMFGRLIEIVPRTTYIASLNLIGPQSYCGIKGESVVITEGDCESKRIRFDFGSISTNNNGTSVERGQIPELIFYVQ